MGVELKMTYALKTAKVMMSLQMPTIGCKSISLLTVYSYI